MSSFVRAVPTVEGLGCSGLEALIQEQTMLRMAVGISFAESAEMSAAERRAVFNLLSQLQEQQKSAGGGMAPPMPSTGLMGMM